MLARGELQRFLAPPSESGVVGAAPSQGEGFEGLLHSELGDAPDAAMFDLVVEQLLRNGDADADELRRAPSAFTEPLCDFIIRLFDLRHRTDWLRRAAIETMLQTILGGTIERCV